MRLEKTEVWGFEHAIRGARNPMNSWSKSDSGYGCEDKLCKDCGFSHDWCGCSSHYVIGLNDMKLLQKLIKAGPEHRKFMRQIMVSVDITAPMYIWSEFDTYKVGTVANSTSKMHKLASTPITRECFEMDDYKGSLLMYEREPYNLNAFTDDMWDNIIDYCETLRQRYLKTKDIKYWKELIRILPESWLQTRTVTMNYENLLAMCSPGQRRFHKLTEWSDSFIKWARELPYAQELIFIDEIQ